MTSDFDDLAAVSALGIPAAHPTRFLTSALPVRPLALCSGCLVCVVCGVFRLAYILLHCLSSSVPPRLSLTLSGRV